MDRDFYETAYKSLQEAESHKFMNTKLYKAALQGSLESKCRERIIKLLKQGALADFGMRGAAECGHKELVEFFIEYGANDWNYGMYCAAQGGHKELVDFFIEHGASKLNLGMCFAIDYCHKELVEHFIKCGANDWRLGMVTAVRYGYKELVDLFIEHGANAWNYGMCISAQGGNKELVDLFIKKGADDFDGGLIWSETASLKIFFIDQGASNIARFPPFYQDICLSFHLPNGVLINKLLRRYIARFKGSKVRNEKVIINDIYETTLDQVFISPPGTIVKFRNIVYQVKGHIFYLIKSRNPQFK